MALRLRVRGQQAARLGERATRVFGVHGGRIGRASDNDWPLPDPERFLSGHHAAIDYRGGTWFIVDTSSNGTFLNDATVPIGRDHAQVLSNGDRLRMGEYDFLVSLSPDNDFPPDVTAVAALDKVAEADLSLATHGDLGAELDMKRLISDPNPPPDEAPPLRLSDAYGQAVTIAPGRPESAPATRTLFRPMASGRAGASTGQSPALQAFCRGAGLEPSTLAPEQATAALALAGQLVREMALGLLTSLQHRADQRARYGAGETAIEPAENNVFKVSGSVDEALARLFAARSSRFLAPLEAVRASFAALHRHDQATLVAIQDALAEYLRRFAPEELEQQFGRSLERNGPPPAQPGQKYWEMYAEMYRVLSQATPAGLPHAFADEFARAYDTANEELRQRARRPAASPARRNRETG
jgi:type VI secretion system FHA domain protein